jgi:succinoglycan biosynthesis transport protein ExoP
MTEQTVPVEELSALLWRRRRIIATVFAVGAASVVLLAILESPTYRATATLMLTSARATIAVSPDANERPRVDPVTEADIGSEVAMLSSTNLLREVLAPHRDRLRADAAEERSMLGDLLRLPRTLVTSGRSPSGASELDAWAEDVERHLNIAGVGRSNLIEVTYDTTDPQWAAQLVNELVAHHLERHVRLNQQTSTQQFFESQRVLLAAKLRDAEGALRDFYQRERIDATSTALPVLRDRVSKLSAALADAETELAEATAEGNFLSRALAALPKDGPAQTAIGSAAPTSGVALIKARLVELQLQRSQMLAQFAPTSIKVTDVDRQIAEAKQLLEQEKRAGGGSVDPTYQAVETNLTQTRARAAALDARVGALRTQLESNRGDLARLGSVASEQERLEQDVSAAKEALSTYLKKAEEARFSNALDESRIVNVSVIEPAVPPETPVPSKRPITIALGLLVSLGAAVGMGFLRDRLDPTVKSAAEVERVTGLPVLAELPIA